jgi:hypothetical protein
MKVYIGPYRYWGWPHRALRAIGLEKLANWLNKRKVKVKIHGYDSWNADHTIALIAIPILKQLMENKHGIPASAFTDEDEMMTDPGYEAAKDRWNNNTFRHIIWSLEQVASDENIIDDFWIHKIDGFAAVIDGGNPGTYNWDARLAYDEKVREGLRLFGEHFQSLWD